MFWCSQSAAVFDFELIDRSLEGAIRAARADEHERLARKHIGSVGTILLPGFLLLLHLPVGGRCLLVGGVASQAERPQSRSLFPHRA